MATKDSLSLPQDRLEVRVELWRCGYASLSQWGRAHGFSPRLVSYTLNKWVGRPDQFPLGKKTKAILLALSQTIGQPVHPRLTQSRQRKLV
jgi:hypothetical protein